MAKIFFYIRNSKITNPNVLNSLWDPEGQGHVTLKDGKYTCEVLPEGRRSLPQNSYFHAMLPLILKGLRDIGWGDEIKNVDHVKTFLKGKFLKREMVNHDTGEVVEYIKDTHDLTVSEFGEFMEDVAKFCAEWLHFALPAPGAQFEMDYFNTQIDNDENQNN